MKTRDLIPQNVIALPSNNLFVDGSEANEMLMTGSYKRLALYAVDHHGHLFCVQSMPNKYNLDWVSSLVDTETGERVANILGNDLENICRRNVYSLRKWLLTETVGEDTVPQPVIDDLCIIDGYDTVLDDLLSNS